MCSTFITEAGVFMQTMALKGDWQVFTGIHLTSSSICIDEIQAAAMVRA
tara:strand:+ start:25784 stop:25930 length:147 start_codon:yes stop_codon:yes gene_type:complete